MKLKPIYSLQIAYAIMIIVETTQYGLGKNWLIFGIVIFGLLTILNFIIEVVNIFEK